MKQEQKARIGSKSGSVILKNAQKVIRQSTFANFHHASRSEYADLLRLRLSTNAHRMLASRSSSIRRTRYEIARSFFLPTTPRDHALSRSYRILLHSLAHLPTFVSLHPVPALCSVVLFSISRIFLDECSCPLRYFQRSSRFSI